MIKRILLIIVSIIYLTACSWGQKRKGIPSEKPKLVVGIVVDQMRYDFIYRYWDKFGENGFKRLVNMGTVCKDANFEHQLLVTGVGHASISTGTYPHFHGIVSNDWYDRLKEGSIYCVQDKNVRPVGTLSEEGLMSPQTYAGNQYRR